MKSGLRPILPALILLALPLAAQHVDPLVCAECHPRAYDTWRKSAMAQSFYKADASRVPAGTFHHEASETYFSMIRRDGRFYQRRWQIGFGGKETNIDEESIDYVMGSGEHVRTFLHRTPSGALQQLPLAWYAEKGGYFAMNPGYDKPDQPNARRKINYECMFCHNAYPQIVAGHDRPRAEPLYSGELPEGIDCERCHGPGQKHVETARTPGAPVVSIRAAIVNPARLSPERRDEVCLQCHLETTSFPFTHSIVKYDRGPFSYRAGEPLADFIYYFDHAPSRPAVDGNDDRFQIVSSAYQLRMSECFLKSKGALQCTTCHDPHAPEKTPAEYDSVCRSCHAQAFTAAVNAGRHTDAANCIVCHMPKRRTEDVVHAVMTDHRIQRRVTGRDLTADFPERDGPDTYFHGSEVAYYSESVPALYLGVAQVHSGTNTNGGIPMLSRAIAQSSPREPEFYTELGDAMRMSGRAGESIRQYDKALALKPDSLAALLGFGEAQDALNRQEEALKAFSSAAKASPDDAYSWLQVGQTLLKLDRKTDARAALQKSIALDPGVPEAHYAIALVTGDDSELREAIRLQPDDAAAHLNLAIALARANQAAEAEWHFLKALKYRPDYDLAHSNYSLFLRGQGRVAEAEEQSGKVRQPNAR